MPPSNKPDLLKAAISSIDELITLETKKLATLREYRLGLAQLLGAEESKQAQQS